MAIAALKTSCFLRQSKGTEENLFLRFQIHKKSVVSIKSSSIPIMASLTVSSPATIGLSETFAKLKKQGKVALIPYITAGDPDLSTTAEALKCLIHAAATRSLAKGTNFDAILSMLEGVVPQLSCPIALFTYYNPILKRGVGKFMTTIKDVGVHGLVVPDVPLEETEILRKEALNNNIELVLLTTPTTPTERMKSIVDASEGFVYLVSSIGVTVTRSSVSLRVESLLRDIKKALGKLVVVGFGISKPEHVKLVAGWGADGVIVGSAMVKILGEANSPEEGLKELEAFTKSIEAALP
ncbi:hypothetical protein MKX01_001609 [Papaver californicum]|nr:hypothetical protein MKX01_001609 [Papaver californicum]